MTTLGDRGCSAALALVLGFFAACGGSTESHVTPYTGPAVSTTVFSGPVKPMPCIPIVLPVQGDAANCTLTAVSFTTCDCNQPGLSPFNEVFRSGVEAELRKAGFCDASGEPACSAACLCAVTQLSGAAADDCRDGLAASAAGWCYIAPKQGIGNLSQVTTCRSDMRQGLRVFGSFEQSHPALMLACSEEGSLPTSTANTSGAALGRPCLPQEELSPDFPGYTVSGVSVERGNPTCKSGVCLIQGFQGRASCPYGQIDANGGCVTASGEPVSVSVEPQLVQRRADLGATCSCRCAGSGPGPYCSCGNGMKCLPLLASVGLDEDDSAGSYCVPDQAVYEMSTVHGNVVCDPSQHNCD